MEEKTVDIINSYKEPLDMENIKNEDNTNSNQKDKFEREKERLLQVMKRIEGELKKNPKDNISQIYSNNNEEIKKNKKMNEKHSKIMFKFMLLLYSSIYLSGIFIIISIEESLWSLFKISLACRVDIFCDKDEFYERTQFFKYFFDKTIKQPIDFNLIMFWNVIGLKMLSSCGFRATIILFSVLNTVIFLFIYNIDYGDYEPDTYKYSFSKILLIFLLWLLTNFCFGSITLLSNQTINNYYLMLNLDKEEKKKEKLKEKEEEINELKENEVNLIEEGFNSIKNKGINDEEDDEVDDENEKNSDKKVDKVDNEKIQKGEESIKIKKIKSETQISSFLIICLSTVLGYIGKLFIFYIISNIRDKENETNNNDSNNSSSYTNNTDYNNILNVNYNNYIYLKKKLIRILQYRENNNSSANETLIDDDDVLDINEDLFFYIGIYFAGSMVLSFLLYQIFLCICIYKIKKEDDKDNADDPCCNTCRNWKCAIELCGYLFYSERISLEKNTYKGGCKLSSEILGNYLENSLCSNCKCCLFLCCCCCCCFDGYNKDDFDKNKQCYCYCYQEKNIYSSLDEFITNETQRDEIIPCMLEYLFSRLIIIACEKEYNDMHENNFDSDKRKKFFYCFVFSAFYYIFCNKVFPLLSHYCFSFCCKKAKKKSNKSDGNNSYQIIKDASALNFMTAYITFFFSLEKLNGNIDESYKYYDYFIFSTVFFNRFFIFSLNFYCTNITENNEGLEFILSQSTSITIYMNIIDIIISLINSIFKDIKTLYYIQIVLSGIYYFLNPCLSCLKIKKNEEVEK